MALTHCFFNSLGIPVTDGTCAGDKDQLGVVLGIVPGTWTLSSPLEAIQPQATPFIVHLICAPLCSTVMLL